MKRRTFTKNLGGGLLLLTTPSPPSNRYAMKKKRLRPSALRSGDTVGLIAPGSPIKEDQLATAISNLEKLGLKVKYTKRILAREGYLAGQDQERLEELHQMFLDDKIRGIWCIRGGYGCPRLLPNIDYKLIRQHPKVLIGYSDITALLQAIHQKTGLVCFHGPVAVSDFTDYTLAQLRRTLMEEKTDWTIENSPATEELPSSLKVIRAGKVKGKLIGGNLSLFTALLGTPYQVSLKNKILFLEDVGEQPYRIDRMLTQLRQATDLTSAKGILLGTFADCEAKDPTQSWPLSEVLENRLGDLGIPVIYGMSFGHISDQFTLPLGIKAEMDTEKATLRLLERSTI